MSRTIRNAGVSRSGPAGVARAAGAGASRNGAGRSWGNRWGLLAAVAAALLAVSLFTGCGDNEPGAASTAPGSVQAGVAQDLTLADLPAELNLTDEQAAAMEGLLAALARDRQARRQRRHPGGRHGSDGGCCGPSPLRAFIETSSEILDPDQFLTLARFLAEHRPAREPHGEPGGMHAGRGLERLAARLGLDDARTDRFIETMTGHQQAMRELRAAVLDGGMEPAAAVEEAEGNVADLEDALRALLTEEQRAQLEALRARHRPELPGGLRARLERQLTRRAAFLGRVLGLEPAPAEQVKQALLGTLDARRQVIEAVHAGDTEHGVAMLQRLEIELGVRAAVREALTPEQVERWDTLRDLLPRHHGHRCGPARRG